MPDEEFEVVLARTGVTYRIPADRTIVQVLEAHGMQLRVSCEQGMCGTCITRVLAGVPDHRDVLLGEDEKAEGKKMTICVSRSKGPRLTLDL